MTDAAPCFDVVVPTAGRASLGRLIDALAAGRPPGRILVVHDRSGRGPAAARNAGWRASEAEWVAFLDDDVVPPPEWARRLAGDIDSATRRVAGIQGRVHVPLPRHRPPTDWERNVAGLAGARWATADMAFRRAALADVGGFDERFPRAYREDADLALRLIDAGWTLARGGRVVAHPVGPATALKSVRLQAGNADDALMDRLHGRDWRDRAGAPRGRRRRHLATVAAAGAGFGGLLARRPRVAAAGAAGWTAGTADLAWARIASGPRTLPEIVHMTATSAAIPFAASGWWLYGIARARRLVARPGQGLPAAVLFDRDGTLVHDVPYNGDPERVEPIAGAREALDRLRRAGVKLAVISNQSGVARGLVTREQVEAVNRRVEKLLGPLGPWLVCEHGPDDACECRKPAPGLVLRAAAELAVDPAACAVVGDIGADVEAARAAGARPILVPNGRTRRHEIDAAPERAPNLEAAVDLLLGGAR